jgi:transglutaminase-like putative cysteine protease
VVLASPTTAPPAGRVPPKAVYRDPTPRTRRHVETARTWIRLALFAVALLVAFASLSTVIAGLAWWFVSAIVIVLPILAIGLARQLGRRPWQPLAAGFLTALVTFTFGFARDAAFLGVIPTFDTVGRWGELVSLGINSISTQRVPAQATEGILFLLAILAVVSVVFIAPALDRVPAAAALPLLVVLDIPVAVRGGIAEPQWFVLVVIAYLALLRVGRRRMPLAAVAGTAAVVIIGSLLLPAAFPPAREVVNESNNGVGTGLNPLIDLGDDLRRNETVTAVTYVTDAPGGLYLRLATLDEFNGINWEPDSTIGAENDIDEFPAPPGLTDEIPRAPYTATVEVGDVGGRWLPIPYPATAIENLEGEWRWEPDGLAVRSVGTEARGQRYDVSFLDIQPDLAQLTADAAPDVPTRYLALPAHMPEIIGQTAQEVAGSGSTYQKAIALQEFFAEGDFTYSVDAPVEDDYDGTGVGVIERFLDVRSGYCVHFASTMAVMARTLDIPSRVVVGFQPGREKLIGDEPGFEVSSADLHAWPELYFEGIGWLRFEPTPGRGTFPDYSNIEAIDDPETPEFEGVNPSAQPVTRPSTGPELPDEGIVDGGPTVVEEENPAPVFAAIGLVLLVLLLSPAALRVIIRLRRMRRVRTGDAAAAWAEIRDTAHDHDWVAPDSETPRQLGLRLAIVVGSEPVARLQDGVESAAYDRPGSLAMSVEDVAELRHAIATAAPFKVRLRAIFLPPSLTARAGFGPRPRDDDDPAG